MRIVNRRRIELGYGRLQWFCSKHGYVLPGWAFLDQPQKMPVRSKYGTFLENDGICVEPCGW